VNFSLRDNYAEICDASHLLSNLFATARL